MRNFYNSTCYVNKKTGVLTGRYFLTQFSRAVLMALMMLLTVSGLKAQTVSGNWDAVNTTGATGYINHGSGVIQLLDVNNANGCQSAAVHETSVKYDPTLGANFSQCYKVYFGCPGNDNIGSDTKGDGMAFSFSKCAVYNINNGSCGGGLGYHGACPQMITIEFDTWSSQCNSGFDCSYGGGATGADDEIALHRNGEASDAGRITSVNAGNLEDGLEHTVCISYNPTTDVYAVTLDGNTIFSYDATGTGNELEIYFGAGGLNQTWSSGKFGATNPATVSHGADIAATMGAPLCPSGVVITSPSNGASFGGCSIDPIDITATATPPAGNTVDYVEFFADGVSIGTDNSATSGYNYGITWNSPTDGNHALTAVAHFTPSGTTSTTTSSTNINVGGGLQLTSMPPTINGTVEALWNSYETYNLTQGHNSAPDLAGNYKIMYDANNLYILVDVTDDDLRNDSGNDWEDDGVEIYIDIGNDKVGCCAYGANDYQYGLKYNDGSAAEYKHAPGSLTGVSFSQGAKAGGYIMEVSIPWSTLGGAPTAGTSIGFDVKINDDDGGGGRDHELAWNDGTFGSWQNPSLFGTHQFVDCDPLPVKLLTFTGKVLNETVVLNWITSEEINNEKFIIERSSGESGWEPIGEVEGGGNLTSIMNYTFTDYDPLEGIAYYRLRQVDFDGASAYSKVVVVQIGVEQLISISPNPFDDILTITSNRTGEMTISIYDVLGRLLYQAKRENENGQLSIHPDLAGGAYLITVQTEAFIEQFKVVKK